MRIVLTRPESDSERSASVLRKAGHDVLVAPLMRVEAVAADLTGTWGGYVVTSANAPEAIRSALPKAALTSRLYAVGKRSADAARALGFTDVIVAGGDVRTLIATIVAQRADAKGPLLYLAGEDRAADLIAELTVHGIAAEMRVVYRAVTTSYTDGLIEALTAREVDAVFHYSKRSAETYVAGAMLAGLAEPALKPRHVCIAEAAAAPLVAAGATDVTIASRPDESAMMALLAEGRH